MMPGIGFEEMILLVLVAIVVVGPKDLPLMMRKFGRFTGKMRAMAFEFKQGFDELGRQAELEELKKEVADLKKATGLDDLRREFEEDKRNFEDDVNSALAATDAPTPAVGEDGAAAPRPQAITQTPATGPLAVKREVFPRPHRRKAVIPPSAESAPYAGLSADHPGYDAGEDFRIDGAAPEPARPVNGTANGAEPHAPEPAAEAEGDVHVIPDDHVRPAHPAARLAPASADPASPDDASPARAKQDTTT